MHYKTRGKLVEAVQWLGDNLNEVRAILPSSYMTQVEPETHVLTIITNQFHSTHINTGNFIVINHDDTIQVLSPGQFDNLYEETIVIDIQE